MQNGHGWQHLHQKYVDMDFTPSQNTLYNTNTLTPTNPAARADEPHPDLVKQVLAATFYKKKTLRAGWGWGKKWKSDYSPSIRPLQKRSPLLPTRSEAINEQLISGAIQRAIPSMTWRRALPTMPQLSSQCEM